MPFMTRDNPALDKRYQKQEHTPKRYSVMEDDGSKRWFETTGERRYAEEGEFLLGPLGVAVAKTTTVAKHVILREVPEPIDEVPI